MVTLEYIVLPILLWACLKYSGHSQNAADFGGKSYTFLHKNLKPNKPLYLNNSIQQGTSELLLLITFSSNAFEFELSTLCIKALHVKVNKPPCILCHPLVSHVTPPAAKVVPQWHGWHSLTMIRRYLFFKKGTLQMQRQISCTMYVPANMTEEDEEGWSGGGGGGGRGRWAKQSKVSGKDSAGNSCRLHFLSMSSAVPISAWIFLPSVFWWLSA